MNHDGWAGTLKMTAVSASNVLTASYVGSDGVTYSVSGSLDSSYGHIARITINFATPQSFTLHYHTWDDKLFSGYTYWNNIRLGVHAQKQ